MKSLFIILCFSLPAFGQDTVFIKNVNDYVEGKVNVLVSPSGRKSVVTVLPTKNDWATGTDTGIYDRRFPPNNKRWETTGIHHENVFYLVDSMTAFVRANTHIYCECPRWQKYLDSLPRIKITSTLKSMLESLNYYNGDEVMPGEIFEVVARPTKEMLIEFPVKKQ